jgi:hypothetical protein
VENTNLLIAILSPVLSAGVLGVFITQLFLRPKTIAEAKKIDAEASKILSELNLKTSPDTEFSGSKGIKGWDKWGEDPNSYEIGVDQNERYRGKPSGYIKSIKEPRGFGSIKQAFQANIYRGKRLKMAACAKSNNVEGWAGLWMRVDGPSRTERTLAFDNMEDRPITGSTGWTSYQIVLDIPENSVAIAFGVLLVGPGQLWTTDFRFEVVDMNVLTTPSQNYPEKPINLSFDE